MLRSLRDAAGLSQRELAERAGVSRQLVGAVENGRHLPRVDAALALADALGVDVRTLFPPEPMDGPVDAVGGEPPRPGALVRLGRVGDRQVSAPVRTGAGGFEPADAIVDRTGLHRLTGLDHGIVMLGCEPALQVVEQMLRERGIGALSAATSTARALGALAAGRAHAAVVHGPAGRLPRSPERLEVARYGLTRWRVGLASVPDARPGWWGDALNGSTPVIQRESGAGVQRSFEEARTTAEPSVGPVVATHLEAALRALSTGLPAVTIEPAAMAVGAVFHPLDLHIAELWIDRRWLDSPVVAQGIDVVTGRRFQRGLEAVGGYDLAGCGARIA